MNMEQFGYSPWALDTRGQPKVKFDVHGGQSDCADRRRYIQEDRGEAKEDQKIGVRVDVG